MVCRSSRTAPETEDTRTSGFESRKAIRDEVWPLSRLDSESIRCTISRHADEDQREYY